MDTHGYLETFRDLLAPPPWVEIEPEDIEAEVPLPEARPLYIQANESSGSELMDYYREYRKEHSLSAVRARLRLLGYPDNAMESIPEGAEREVEQSLVAEFEASLSLARTLGPALVETIASAIFLYDPEDGWSDYITPALGLPDLFVWDDASSLWFFAEVKGPNDRIQPSQYRWIVDNSEKVQGRVIFLSLWPEE